MTIPEKKQHRIQRAVAEAGDPLARAVADVARDCTRCGACVKQCAFLARHGTPKDLADLHGRDGDGARSLAYECSLCGLCVAVCPAGVDPRAMFMEMRRAAVAAGEVDRAAYRRLLAYERRGGSDLYAWWGLPRGCHTVFFPGCALPGTRPGVTVRLYEHLARSVPDLGVVLDCCRKPSHDLGFHDAFRQAFDAKLARLASRGVRRVLTACPNCQRVFLDHGEGLEVVSVYEHMAGHGLPQGGGVHGSGVVHDSCPIRAEAGTLRAVRDIATDKGLELKEMFHKKRFAMCCGEGGAVACRSPELAATWTGKRTQEAGGRMVVAACAGCVNYLGRSMHAVHVLDLAFRPGQVMNGGPRIVKSPFTYLARLWLKSRLKRLVPAVDSRE